MGRLDGKVALVTGAASGIGRETCIKLVREGAEVVAVDVRAITEPIDGTAPFVADVASAADSEAMVAFAESTFGKLDVLFNNAGVMLDGDDDAVTTEEAIWDRTMDINAKGVFFWRRSHRLRGHSGGLRRWERRAFHDPRSAERSRRRASRIAEGRCTASRGRADAGPSERKAERRRPLARSADNQHEKRERRLVHIPMGRFGEATEIADAVVFLASDESSYITGADFVVDGGITAAYVTPQ